MAENKFEDIQRFIGIITGVRAYSVGYQHLL